MKGSFGRDQTRHCGNGGGGKNHTKVVKTIDQKVGDIRQGGGGRGGERQKSFLKGGQKNAKTRNILALPKGAPSKKK